MQFEHLELLAKENHMIDTALQLHNQGRMGREETLLEIIYSLDRINKELNTIITRVLIEDIK